MLEGIAMATNSTAFLIILVGLALAVTGVFLIR
jgi:hypothetical protein